MLYEATVRSCAETHRLTTHSNSENIVLIQIFFISQIYKKKQETDNIPNLLHTKKLFCFYFFFKNPESRLPTVFNNPDEDDLPPSAERIVPKSMPPLLDETAETRLEMITGSKLVAMLDVEESKPSLLATFLVKSCVANEVTGLDAADVLPVKSEVSCSIPLADCAVCFILPKTESDNPLNTLLSKLLPAAADCTCFKIKSVNCDIMNLFFKIML
jgi:hypothetical protein